MERKEAANKLAHQNEINNTPKSNRGTASAPNEVIKNRSVLESGQRNQEPTG
jgi:hypothetical protein